MSVGKKVFLLLFCLVVLTVYSVYSYDYNNILNDNSIDNKTRVLSMYEKYKDKLFSKYDDLKSYIMEKIDSSDVKEDSQLLKKTYNNLELLKKDNKLFLSGIFKDKKQAKEISNILGIELVSKKYDTNLEKNTLLLNKIKSILPFFKKNFGNNSKILIENEKILFTGVLNENANKELLKELLVKNDLDVTFDFKIAKIEKQEEKQQKLPKKEIVVIEQKELEDTKQKVEIESLKKEENNKPIQVSEKEKIQKQINEILKNRKISFQRASVKLKGASYQTVREIVKILKKHPTLKVEIGGHTDSKGKASLNKRISQKRANRVMKAFIDLKIAPSRLKAIGYGEEFPIVKENKLGLAEANRRVEIKIIGE